MLEKLEDMHSQQELKVMEMLHTVEKTAQRVEDGCAFGERLLKNGSPVEVLLLKRVVATQLQSLLGNVPCIADVGKIEFVTDEKLFSNTITATFGRLTAIEPGQQQRAAVSTYSQASSVNIKCMISLLINTMNLTALAFSIIHFIA